MCTPRGQALQLPIQIIYDILGTKKEMGTGGKAPAQARAASATVQPPRYVSAQKKEDGTRGAGRHLLTGKSRTTLAA